MHHRKKKMDHDADKFTMLNHLRSCFISLKRVADHITIYLNYAET